MNIKISKGNFKFNSSGTGTYKINCINECCKGFFILKKDNSREYIQKISDHITILESKREQRKNK